MSSKENGKKRCYACKKPMNSLLMVCPCGKMFCFEHYQPESHNCADLTIGGEGGGGENGVEEVADSGQSKISVAIPNNTSE